METATPTVMPTTDPRLFAGTAGEGGLPVDAIAIEHSSVYLPTDLRHSQFDRSLCMCVVRSNKVYWQVPMEEAAKEKTAFTAGRGLWQFRVMPFGLCNAPATFERLMEQVLSGLPLNVALVYIDILVPSKTII